MRNKLLGFLLLIVMALSFSACTRIEPGFVGIKVNKFGGQKGVEDFPAIAAGVYFYNPITTQYLEFPSYVQTAVWTHKKTEGSSANEEITFQDRDAVPLAADISFSYQLTPKKIPQFYVQFRSDDVSTFTHGFMRNVARNSFSRIGSEYSYDELNGVKKEEFLKKIQSDIQKEINIFGVEIVQFGLLEALRPPENMRQAINAKTQAIQDSIRKENEVRQAKADAQKQVAAAEGDAASRIKRAEGEAKANQLLASSITAPLLEWQRIQIQQQQVGKWNGQLPTTMVPNATIPFMTVK